MKLDRLYDLAAERNVLVGPMWHSEQMPAVIATGLQPSHFWSKANGALYELMLCHYDAGRPYDQHGLVTALGSMANIEKYGGHVYFGEITGDIPGDNPAEAARVVQSYATRRLMVRLGRWVMDKAELGTSTGNLPAETRQLLDRLQEAVIKLSAVGAEASVMHVSEVGRQWLAAQEAFDEGKHTPATKTGIGMLDHTLNGGLYPGDIVTVAGRPGMGKTSLATTISVNMAEQGRAIGVISLEMPPVQIFAKLAAVHGQVPYGAMRSHKLGHHRDAIYRAASGVSGLPLYLTRGARTLKTIHATIRQLKMKTKRDGYALAAVMIDYLGLLKHEDGRLGRYEQVSKNARGLKELAVDEGLGVMVLSQLNRKVEEKKDKIPELSHLRDSGEIEEASDVILLAFRPEYYDPDRQPGLLQLIVAKNRHGMTGELDLNWVGEQGRVSDGPYYPPAVRIGGAQ